MLAANLLSKAAFSYNVGMLLAFWIHSSDMVLLEYNFNKQFIFEGILML